MKKLTLISFVLLSVQLSFSQRNANAAETVGDILLIAMPVATFGTSLIIGDKEGAWQFTKGAVVNQAITQGLKILIDKQRPNGTNNNSFPSGHTSQTFHSASFIHKRYGYEYGIPAYVLAGFTGFSRLNSDQHDMYDILVGAIIGIGSTYLFTTPYQKEHMELTFSSGDGNYLIGFTFKF